MNVCVCVSMTVVVVVVVVVVDDDAVCVCVLCGRVCVSLPLLNTYACALRAGECRLT